MPLLTVVNLTTKAIPVQDPTGRTTFSQKVPPSGTLGPVAVSLELLADLEPQLILEATYNRITWTCKDDPSSAADNPPDYIHVGLTSPVTVAIGDDLVLTNLTTPGAVAVVLPAGAMIGRDVRVTDGKGDAGTNNITVTVAGAGTINGAASMLISQNYGALRLVKTGATSWSGAIESPAGSGGAAGGDLSGSYPNPTVAKVGGYSPTTSTHGGAGNVGKPIILDAAGKIDGVDLSAATGSTTPGSTGTAGTGATGSGTAALSGSTGADGTGATGSGTAALSGSTAADGTGAVTGSSGSNGTGAVTGSTATGSTATMATETNLAPPTAGVAVHARIDDATASPITTGWTSPERPRNLVYDWGASWAGGIPNVSGTDQDDAAIMESPIPALGGSTVGAMIFKTVTRIDYAPGAGGAGHTLDITTGKKLGILAPYSVAVGIASVDGVLDLATFDATLHKRGFTPASAPDGVKNYGVTVPSTATTHTHAAGTLAGPSHSHAAGTLAGPSHSHAVGTLADGGHTHTGPSHSHAVGTIADGGHTHTGPSHSHSSAAHAHPQN